MPKGGGAIKSIGEKFTINAINGTSALEFPLPFSSARNLTPSLSLVYNSGAGNGVFGLGWNLNLSSIHRKTEDGLPTYDDENDSDTFILSDAEDLVPAFKKNEDGTFVIDTEGKFVIQQYDSPDGSHSIRAYMPRVEGLFAKIERWTDKLNDIIKWRIITKENITTLFGWSELTRISDPLDNRRIFKWLPEFIFDDRGNCTQYVYKKDDTKGFDKTLLHHRNRYQEDQLHYTNTYLSKVLYGNRTPYSQFGGDYPAENQFLFSTEFDYGEYDLNQFIPNADWMFRHDAFSYYKAGFEIRTTRLCKRVLLFHHFNGVGEYNGLVKSLDFSYNTDSEVDLTFLQSITSSGYVKRTNGTYSRKTLPPIEFGYQQRDWNKQIQSIASKDLIHAPAGLDDAQFHFTDLYHEGLSGILTEQAGAWYYKHNLGQGEFAPAKLVAFKPAFNGLGSLLQLTDLDADGGKQLVSRHPVYAGYFELDDDLDWQPYQTFDQQPVIDFGNPNIRFLDLNGDGKPDLMMTEENVIEWYPSEGRKGFAPMQKSKVAHDEESGPRIVFSDANQSVFLADMSGDGMTDIVRIRNGEVCYWPNLGFGKFGSKVTMDHSPQFDHPDAFNGVYIRLADIDGSGNSDVIYLGKNKFSCWLNLSGNRFSDNPIEIEFFAEIHNRAQVRITDLLGNGVPCIVWSSALSKDTGSSLRYVDLMNSKKPHVLSSYKNNMGKEVVIDYLPSTKYYLDDKNSGRPWSTRLHFPVHCVNKTITLDKITGNQYTRTYKYHHGYYDHVEKEFRGFAMVEQIDAETFEHWISGEASNIVEAPLHQEPVISRTWFHTGAFRPKEISIDPFEDEYWYREMERKGFSVTHHEVRLPGTNLIVAHNVDPSLLQKLTGEEWQEALRACKGLNLRNEMFALDAAKFGNTDEAKKRELTPYDVTIQNCIIELLQPKGYNRHAVFVVKKSESIAFHYERNAEDPRIAHSLNILLDEFGNVLESAAIVYPRKNPDVSLPSETQQAQSETIIIYRQNKFTNDVTGADVHRLRLPSEASTYQLKGVSKTKDYYQPSDFNDILKDAKSDEVSFHEIDKLPGAGKALRRCLEHTKSKYYKNDLTGTLPQGKLESLAFSFESYQLAYSPQLVDDIFDGRVNSGLLTEGNFSHLDGDTKWWLRSGVAHYIRNAETVLDAKNRFYQPVSYTDSVNSITEITYDNSYSIFIQQVRDSLGNTSSVEKFNYRTLTPQRTRDLNGNFAEMVIDELGLVKSMARFGKGNDADDLLNFTEETDIIEGNEIREFFIETNSVQLTAKANNLLKHATTRFIYNLEPDIQNDKPVVCAIISREQHFKQNNNSPIQISFEYLDGLGEVLYVKKQAEPGPAKKVVILPDGTITIEEVDTATDNPKQLRWIGNGRTIRNNKGNPVKQYESYFSVTPQFEGYKELTETGVTSLMYYDAPGRLIKTVMPNGTISRVEFDAWKQKNYDANDMVSDPDCTWFTNRSQHLIDAKLLAEGKDPNKEKQAADRTIRHALTPQVLHFNTLGRTILSIQHTKDIATDADQFYLTSLKQDVQGNKIRITDARLNVVIQYKYDMLGGEVFQHSMDSGKRWVLNNVLGDPVRLWDERNHEFRYSYDSLHRPIESKVIGGDGGSALNHIYGKTIYGETLLLPDQSNKPALQAKNILGRPIQFYDTGGLIEIPDYDFEGNPGSISRRLFKKYKDIPDWTNANLVNDLENKFFTYQVLTDAIGRLIQQHTPDGSLINRTYNATGLLSGVSVQHAGSVVTSQYLQNIEYNERGQRTKIRFGNQVVTKYHYDKETFRLIRQESRRQNNEGLQDLHFTYDPVGNITHIEDKNVPVTFFDNSKTTGLSEYTYDPLYQLIRATGRENTSALMHSNEDNWNDASFMHDHAPGDASAIRNYTQHYTYDEAGNIIQIRHVAPGNNWTRQLTYENSNNRLLKTGIGDSASPINYNQYQHHAQHGFLLSLPHLQDLGWNFKEELVKSIRQKVNAGNGTAETTYYQYDGQGQRIRKITENSAGAGADPTIKEERVYVAGYEFYKKHTGSNAGLERETLSLAEQGHRYVMIETRNNVNDGTAKQLVRYQLHNHIGSATLETDDNANIITYEEYHPYGTTSYQARNNAILSAAKRYRYSGMERDEETGLSYHGARYYISWLGRWLNCDPLGIDDSPNVYQYSRGNPITFIDTEGLCATECGEEEKDKKPDAKKKAGTKEEKGKAESGSFFGDLFSSIASAIGGALVAVGKWIAETAVKIWNWIKETATAAWNWIKQAATDAWNWIKGALQTAWDWTKNAISAAWNWVKNAAASAWNWIKDAAKTVWNWLSKDDGFFEDFIEVVGHLTWGLPATLVGLTITIANLTIGNLLVAIHNIFTDDAHDWEYASISIGGPSDEDDIVSNYGGFFNLAALTSAITFGPFVVFNGSLQEAKAQGATGVKDFYANHETVTAGHPYGAVTGLRTADHEEGHEDQNLIYGPFTLLLGLIFSLLPNAFGGGSGWFWYDRQANRFSGKNSVFNPNTAVHP